MPRSAAKLAVSWTTRQYLVGRLARPQALPAVDDERLEMGVTSYARAHSEPEHRHTEATEYHYVLSGWTQYLDTDAGVVHDFVAGDFYAIEPGTRYAQRSRAGTAIVFVKVPSTNDKALVEPSPETAAWLADRPRTVRTDYDHDPAAPAANSVRPAASLFLREGERVLLLRRADSGNWTLPGGTLEMDESLVDCAVREAREETGLDVAVDDLVATYTDPEVRVAYSDGEVRREFTVLFAGSVRGGAVATDDESTAWGWFTFDDIAHLPMAASQRRRLADCQRWLSTGERRLR